MATRKMWRVRSGSLLLDPKSGGVVAFAGQDVAEDHPAVLAHPSIGSDCYPVEVECDAPAPVEAAPAVKPATWTEGDYDASDTDD